VKRFRGPVNLAIGDKGKLSVLLLSPDDDSGEDECTISPDSEIGLLVALLRETRKSTVVHLAKPQYAAELVDEEVLAPS
jgi:hypothetical protein